jgi:hypothetical protein
VTNVNASDFVGVGVGWGGGVFCGCDSLRTNQD